MGKIFSKEEIEVKIKKTLRDMLSIDYKKINMSSLLVDSLSADSLDIIELVLNLENDYNIEIPDSNVEKFKTVEDIVNCVFNLTSKKA